MIHRPDLMTKSEYARHRKVNFETVSRAIKNGKINSITIDGREYIDHTEADALWAERSEEWRVEKEREQKEQKLQQAMSDPEEIKGPKKGTYQEWRTQKEAMNAALAKLELDERSGNLVNARDVSQTVFQANRMVRDAFMSWPDRVCGQLCSITDPNEMHSFITAEFTKILENLVEKFKWEKRNVE